ncbi:MAG: hypothetical protein IKV35_03945, partial [Clostridia bacterium]|nr:hypothetical protein [Clostridia bacterium]
MKLMKKVLASVLAVVLAVSMLLMSGCSTPKVAMTVDGVEYTTGEFLAAMYAEYYYAYYQTGLYQYEMYYGTDPWTQTFPYGEEGAQVQLALADYIVQAAKDAIIRQTAVQKMLKQEGVAVDAEGLAELKNGIAGVSANDMLKYGFSKESYIKISSAQLEESSLFFGIYGKGGRLEVPEADIRAHFDKSFVAYKAITLSQVDGEGKALTDEEKAKNKEKLEKYLELYNEKKDIDAVIEQYNADVKAEEEAAKTTTTTTT